MSGSASTSACTLQLTTFDQVVEIVIDKPEGKSKEFTEKWISDMAPRTFNLKACESGSIVNTWEVDILKLPNYPYPDVLSVVLKLKTTSGVASLRVGVSLAWQGNPVGLVQFRTIEPGEVRLPLKLAQWEICWVPFLKNLMECGRQCLQFEFGHEVTRLLDPCAISGYWTTLGARLMAKQHLSDLKVLAKDGQLFPGHKLILAVQSPVFEHMFQSQMNKQAENVLALGDFQSESVKCFMGYLYGASMVTDKLYVAVDMLVLGEKYAMAELKHLAESRICDLIEVASVCQMLAIAYLHRSEVLKDFCTKFIIRNQADVTKLHEWAQLKELHHPLYEEVLQMLKR